MVAEGRSGRLHAGDERGVGVPAGYRKHLEPLGGCDGDGHLGLPPHAGFPRRQRRSPGSAPGIAELRQQERDADQRRHEAALRGIVAAKDLAIEWPAPESAPPLWKFRQHRRSVHRTSVRYGNLPSQLLDVWRPQGPAVEPAPVLIFVPGGAWVHGSRLLQGYALMSHLAEMGWVCLSIDYRVAPHHRWPQHITDVKTAIAWARANVDKFGGDRNFVAIAGCSAGGHLAALAGLTANDPEMQARTAGGLRHLGGRRRRHLRPLRLGGPLDGGAGALRRLPRAGRGRSARSIEAPGRVPQGVADRAGTSGRAAVPGHPRHRRQRHSGRAGSQLRRDSCAACRVRWSATWSCLARVTAFDMTDGARTGSTATAIGLFLNQIHRNRSLIEGQSRLYEAPSVGRREVARGV